jgi:type II secretory pathway pseudopilin PulG
MKLESKSSSALIVAMLLLAALAAAFWILALSPKREEASELAKQVSTLEASLAQHRGEAAEALEARREFPVDYQQLVVLGKAVPGDDDTASLIVQLNGIAKHAKVEFRDITLEAGEGGEEAPAAPAPAEGSQPVSATEVAASTMPLGATIGPAGLGVMPYTLTFDGDFFRIADFIKGLDSLVKTENEKVSVNGRLFTIDGFSLAPGPNGFPDLEASFSITTYLTPPEEGVTGGATPASPAPVSSTPAAVTTGGTP